MTVNIIVKSDSILVQMIQKGGFSFELVKPVKRCPINIDGKQQEQEMITVILPVRRVLNMLILLQKESVQIVR